MTGVNWLALRIRKTVAAPPAVVWELLVDTRQWPRWGPSVLAVESSDERIVAGSQGRVRTAAGIWVPFRITAVDEPWYWHWQVCGVSATGHRLRALAAGRTELIFEIPWPAAPYGMVCRKAAKSLAKLSEAEANSGVERQAPQ